MSSSVAVAPLSGGFLPLSRPSQPCWVCLSPPSAGCQPQAHTSPQRCPARWPVGRKPPPGPPLCSRSPWVREKQRLLAGVHVGREGFPRAARTFLCIHPAGCGGFKGKTDSSLARRKGLSPGTAENCRWGGASHGAERAEGRGGLPWAGGVAGGLLEERGWLRGGGRFLLATCWNGFPDPFPVGLSLVTPSWGLEGVGVPLSATPSAQLHVGVTWRRCPHLAEPCGQRCVVISPGKCCHRQKVTPTQQEGAPAGRSRSTSQAQGAGPPPAGASPSAGAMQVLWGQHPRWPARLWGGCRAGFSSRFLGASGAGCACFRKRAFTGGL